MSKIYRVDEIFLSISGETSTVGMPTVFVRLHGCNLNCPYCDTPQHNYKDRYDYEILAEVIRVSRGGVYNHVVLTGGEPLDQDVEPLVKMLIHHDFHIQIETNGTKPLLKNRHPWVSYAMDVKLPSSGVSQHMLEQTEKNVKELYPDDEIKFVVADDTDFETAIKWINRYKPTSKLLFSPMFNEDGTIAYPDLVDNLLALDLENWRVQIQMHKILNCK